MVLDMKLGERARLTSPASLAFGAPHFPPAEQIDERLRASDVTIEIELVGVNTWCNGKIVRIYNPPGNQWMDWRVHKAN